MLIQNNLLDKIHNTKFLELSGTIPNESIDLIVTSPPFNIGKEYETKQPLKQYLEWMKKVLSECTRILTSSGSIFWQVGTYVGEKGSHFPLDVMLFPIFLDLNLLPRNRIIWIRQHGTHAKYKFSNRHEVVMWFTKSHDYKFNLNAIRVPQKFPKKKNYRKGKDYGKYSCDPRGKNPGDVWAFRNVKHNHEEQTEHPCQFPEDMITRIMLATTDVKDIVLDPFIGSGTTALVAKRYDRRYIGCEIIKKYVEISNQRLKGLPDKNNSFPNLKTLREYVDKTEAEITDFKFARQVGNTPTHSKKSKIYPEYFHLNNTIERLKFEANNSIFNKDE